MREHWIPQVSAHGARARAVARACQAVLPGLLVLNWAGILDSNKHAAAAWQALYSWPPTHWTMAEGLVAALSFAFWITWFELLDQVPLLQRYRFSPRASVMQESPPHGMKHSLRVLLSFPAYMGAIFLFHFVRTPKPIQAEPPSAGRFVAEVLLGLWAYDFIFFWLHLAMHVWPRLPHGHGIHHQLKKQSPGHEFIEADTVVHHSLFDAALQVGTNIVVQNLPLFGGMPKHKMSRFAHNVIITYLLTELHAGLDLPWAVHRLCPALWGGALRHEIHHHNRDCCFQQFFKYLDDALGYGPPSSAATRSKQC